MLNIKCSPNSTNHNSGSRCLLSLIHFLQVWVPALELWSPTPSRSNWLTTDSWLRSTTVLTTGIIPSTQGGCRLKSPPQPPRPPRTTAAKTNLVGWHGWRIGERRRIHWLVQRKGRRLISFSHWFPSKWSPAHFFVFLSPDRVLVLNFCFEGPSRVNLESLPVFWLCSFEVLFFSFLFCFSLLVLHLRVGSLNRDVAHSVYRRGAIKNS